MRAVGVRELKNRLSEYLRLVRTGEAVLVTDRGRVVAELRQPVGISVPEPMPGLTALARRGSLSPGGTNAPEAYPRLKAVLSRGRTGRLLDQERGER